MPQPDLPGREHRPGGGQPRRQHAPIQRPARAGVLGNPDPPPRNRGVAAEQIGYRLYRAAVAASGEHPVAHEPGDQLDLQVLQLPGQRLAHAHRDDPLFFRRMGIRGGAQRPDPVLQGMARQRDRVLRHTRIVPGGTDRIGRRGCSDCK
jgi:hypothetical protein